MIVTKRRHPRELPLETYTIEPEVDGTFEPFTVEATGLEQAFKLAIVQRPELAKGGFSVVTPFIEGDL